MVQVLLVISFQEAYTCYSTGILSVAAMEFDKVSALLSQRKHQNIFLEMVQNSNLSTTGTWGL